MKFNEECSKECIRENTHFCEHHTVNDTGPNTYFSSTLLIQNFLFTDMTYRNILFTVPKVNLSIALILESGNAGSKRVLCLAFKTPVDIEMNSIKYEVSHVNEIIF